MSLNIGKAPADGPNPEKVEPSGESVTLDVAKPEVREPEVPEGFAEALKGVKSPKDLKALMDKFKAPEEPPLTKETNQGPADNVKKVEDAKLDLNSLGDEWAKNNGKLTPKTLESLKAKGISQADVESYVAHKTNTVMQSVAAELDGGVETLKEVMTWARSNLTDAEKNSWDKAMSDPEGLGRLMVAKVHQRYLDANGSDPGLVSAQSASARGVKGYESMEDASRDMAKPEYRTSESFRRKVEARLAASRW